MCCGFSAILEFPEAVLSIWQMQDVVLHAEAPFLYTDQIDTSHECLSAT